MNSNWPYLQLGADYSDVAEVLWIKPQVTVHRLRLDFSNFLYI